MDVKGPAANQTPESGALKEGSTAAQQTDALPESPLQYFRDTVQTHQPGHFSGIFDQACAGDVTFDSQLVSDLFDGLNPGPTPEMKNLLTSVMNSDLKFDPSIPKVDIQQAKSLTETLMEQLQEKSNTVDDLGADAAERLARIMDRLTAFLAALSNTSNLTDTAGSIVQDLK